VIRICQSADPDYEPCYPAGSASLLKSESFGTSMKQQARTLSSLCCAPQPCWQSTAAQVYRLPVPQRSLRSPVCCRPTPAVDAGTATGVVSWEPGWAACHGSWSWRRSRGSGCIFGQGWAGGTPTCSSTVAAFDHEGVCALSPSCLHNKHG